MDCRSGRADSFFDVRCLKMMRNYAIMFPASSVIGLFCFFQARMERFLFIYIYIYILKQKQTEMNHLCVCGSRNG